MNKPLILIIMVLSVQFVSAQEYIYKTKQNEPYYDTEFVGDDKYIKQQCVLDIYYPENKSDFATLIWFHGGGLRAGDKEIPERLKNQGIAIVGVKYRLYPEVKCPVYIEDAAAAVAWVFKNITKYGGDHGKIFISGHSAGGYLASMVGLDTTYLQKHNINANKIAGLIPFSGHTITHFTVREEMGIDGKQPIIDKYAPLYHVRADAPPLLLITGNREMELLGRYEENAYMYRMMRVAGHTQTQIMELDGYDHGMVEPALPLILKEMKRILGDNF